MFTLALAASVPPVVESVSQPAVLLIVQSIEPVPEFVTVYAAFTGVNGPPGKPDADSPVAGVTLSAGAVTVSVPAALVAVPLVLVTITS